jgi:hypothetical protein
VELGGNCEVELESLRVGHDWGFSERFRALGICGRIILPSSARVPAYELDLALMVPGGLCKVDLVNLRVGHSVALAPLLLNHEDILRLI